MRITELFDNGQFVVTAEVGPPKGIDASHVVNEAKEFLSGITAVNVTDNQSSVMRMGSLPACVALKNVKSAGVLRNIKIA
jgi:5,10-methylenetetrahydrofolate reductase